MPNLTIKSLLLHALSKKAVTRYQLPFTIILITIND